MSIVHTVWIGLGINNKMTIFSASLHSPVDLFPPVSSGVPL